MLCQLFHTLFNDILQILPLHPSFRWGEFPQGRRPNSEGFGKIKEMSWRVLDNLKQACTSNL
jgi:hypothetical protein